MAERRPLWLPTMAERRRDERRPRLLGGGWRSSRALLRVDRHAVRGARFVVGLFAVRHARRHACAADRLHRERLARLRRRQHDPQALRLRGRRGRDAREQHEGRHRQPRRGGRARVLDLGDRPRDSRHHRGQHDDDTHLLERHSGRHGVAPDAQGVTDFAFDIASSWPPPAAAPAAAPRPTTTAPSSGSPSSGRVTANPVGRGR
jgi:hypothetical protein